MYLGLDMASLYLGATDKIILTKMLLSTMSGMVLIEPFSVFWTPLRVRSLDFLSFEPFSVFWTPLRVRSLDFLLFAS